MVKEKFFTVGSAGMDFSSPSSDSSSISTSLISAWILLTASHYHFTEYHIGIVDKVLVHSDAVFIDTEVYPIFVSLNDSVSLLDEDNIRDWARLFFSFCSALALFRS